MTDPQHEPSSPPPAGDVPEVPYRKSRVVRGVAYFIVLTLGAFVVLFIYTVTPETISALSQIDYRFFLVTGLLLALDLVLSTARYQIFFRKLKPGTTPWLPLRADLANRFLGAITPSQTGGGPAQLFVLYRGGISIATGAAVTVINFMSTLTFFLIAGSITAFALHDRFSQGTVRLLARWGLIAFATVTVVFVIAMWRPALFKKAVQLIVRLIAKLGARWGDKVSRIGDTVVASLNRFHRIVAWVFVKQPLLVVWSFLLTVVLYVNKFTIAYFIMLGLGVSGDYLTVIGIQTVLMFVVYFAPSPGASGIAELATGALMAMVLPNHLLGVFTILYRMIMLYVPAAAGGFVLTAELKATASPSRRRPARRPGGQEAEQSGTSGWSEEESTEEASHKTPSGGVPLS